MIYGKPHDIFALQIWYNIRSFICRRHISSHDSAILYRRYITRSTRNGYHWKSEPLPVDKSSLFHGASDGNRTRMVSLGSWSSTTELRLQMLELVVRFELTTCWLRISCTTPVLHHQQSDYNTKLFLLQGVFCFFSKINFPVLFVWISGSFFRYFAIWKVIVFPLLTAL